MVRIVVEIMGAVLWLNVQIDQIGHNGQNVGFVSGSSRGFTGQIVQNIQIAPTDTKMADYDVSVNGIALNKTISPRDLAKAIGTSESSLKRWADQGLLQVTRTGGGHRRITLKAAINFIRDRSIAVLDPASIGRLQGWIPSRRTATATDFLKLLESGEFVAAQNMLMSLALSPGSRWRRSATPTPSSLWESSATKCAPRTDPFRTPCNPVLHSGDPAVLTVVSRTVPVSRRPVPRSRRIPTSCPPYGAGP